eukprot:Opistho-2@63505
MRTWSHSSREVGCRDADAWLSLVQTYSATAIPAAAVAAPTRKLRPRKCQDGKDESAVRAPSDAKGRTVPPDGSGFPAVRGRQRFQTPCLRECVALEGAKCGGNFEVEWKYFPHINVRSCGVALNEARRRIAETVGDRRGASPRVAPAKPNDAMVQDAQALERKQPPFSHVLCVD